PGIGRGNIEPLCHRMLDLRLKAVPFLPQPCGIDVYGAKTLVRRIVVCVVALVAVCGVDGYERIVVVIHATHEGRRRLIPVPCARKMLEAATGSRHRGDDVQWEF